MLSLTDRSQLVEKSADALTTCAGNRRLARVRMCLECIVSNVSFITRDWLTQSVPNLFVDGPLSPAHYPTCCRRVDPAVASSHGLHIFANDASLQRRRRVELVILRVDSRKLRVKDQHA